MNSLLHDISTLSCIPQLTLENICKLAEKSIADAVLETLLSKEDISSIDIGIGILNIKIEENSIKYKFIPSKKLDSIINYSITNKVSPIVASLDDSLNKRIKSTYKELL